MSCTNVLIMQASSAKDLEGIMALHHANLGKTLSDQERESEGFVAAEYSLDFLQLMHDAEPSIIAKDGDTVVGYALVATKGVCWQHALLRELLQSIEALSYGGKSLADTNYIVVGQLCVAKGYRGQGLAMKMYEHYRKFLSIKYTCAITEVAASNQRSVRAHEKSGFKIIATTVYNGLDFHVVIYDWTPLPNR